MRAATLATALFLSSAAHAQPSDAQRRAINHIGDVLAAAEACGTVASYSQIRRYAALAQIDVDKEPALGLIFERKHAAAAAFKIVPWTGPHCAKARQLYGPTGTVFPNLLPHR